MSKPRDLHAVDVVRIIFDSCQETVPDFRSGVNRDADTQQVKHQGCQTFDEKHLKKLKIKIVGNNWRIATSILLTWTKQ